MTDLLKNEFISISVKSKGAELTSLKTNNDQCEYLWTADPAYWGRHAPVLFPIVGQVENLKYTFEGKEYEIGQHGFARDMDFALIEQTEDKLIYEIVFNEETLKKFPFKFKLEITYMVQGNQVHVQYKVVNEDLKSIYFSIGAHPGFNCPLTTDETMEDYSLIFNENETIERRLLVDELLSGKRENFLRNKKAIPVSKELFERAAIIVENFKSNSITLQSNKSQKYVKMIFEEFPYLGIWSPATGAPFVCIEPWFGIASTRGGETDFSKKEGVIKLEIGSTFLCQYIIEIG